MCTHCLRSKKSVTMKPLKTSSLFFFFIDRVSLPHVLFRGKLSLGNFFSLT